MDVVGTMFFKNSKLLIDKPRKRQTYQMIGGKVEKGETSLEAAIRECREELGSKAIFDEKLFQLVQTMLLILFLYYSFSSIFPPFLLLLILNLKDILFYLFLVHILPFYFFYLLLCDME